MCDGSDDGGGNGDGNNIVPRPLDQEVDNDIKHSRVGHYAEIDNGEDKQDSVTGGSRNTFLDEASDFNGAKL